MKGIDWFFLGLSVALLASVLYMAWGWVILFRIVAYLGS